MNRVVASGGEPAAGRRALVGDARLAGVRRTQPVSGSPLLAPGAGVPDLQRGVGDERALHRRSADAGEWRWLAGRSARSRALSRDRHGCLGVSAGCLRQRRRDGRLGAMGGNDRVHDDGADLAVGAHARGLALQHHLRAGPLRLAVGSAVALLQRRSEQRQPGRSRAHPARGERELPRIRHHGGGACRSCSRSGARR